MVCILANFTGPDNVAKVHHLEHLNTCLTLWTICVLKHKDAALSQVTKDITISNCQKFKNSCVQVWRAVSFSNSVSRR